VVRVTVGYVVAMKPSNLRSYPSYRCRCHKETGPYFKTIISLPTVIKLIACTSLDFAELDQAQLAKMLWGQTKPPDSIPDRGLGQVPLARAHPHTPRLLKTQA